MKSPALAAMILAATIISAHAADTRKIDFSQVILDQDDKPIVVLECVDPTDLVATADGRKDCRNTKPVTYTLGIIAQRALNLPEGWTYNAGTGVVTCDAAGPQAVEEIGTGSAAIEFDLDFTGFNVGGSLPYQETDRQDVCAGDLRQGRAIAGRTTA